MTLSPSNSPSARTGLPRIVAAQNDIFIDSSGNRLIDLFSGNGAALLGHTNPHIAAAIKRQLDSVWLTGGLTTPIHDEAQSKLNNLLPATHCVTRFYSTGMEAAEFAIRLARVHTARSDIAGFTGSMHGKSAATAPLGWANALPMSGIHRLPSFATVPEMEVLAQLEKLLATDSIAAVFVEPILGTGGGYIASPNFCTKLIALCHTHGTLAIFDEILTGLHRTGPRFVHSTLPTPPDILLLGKALGNGFPVSAVAARRDIPITPAMLPGSTFADNPLAAAAVVATLTEFSKLDLSVLIAAIARTVAATLGELPGATLRGQGALWMLELQAPLEAQKIAETLYQHGVFISYTANYLRLLPAATITPLHLQQACGHVQKVLREAWHA